VISGGQSGAGTSSANRLFWTEVPGDSNSPHCLNYKKTAYGVGLLVTLWFTSCVVEHSCRYKGRKFITELETESPEIRFEY
jgi:hypothetical protein